MKFRVTTRWGDYDTLNVEDFYSIDKVREKVNRVEALKRSKEFVGKRSDADILEIIKITEVEVTPDENEVKKFMDEFKAAYLKDKAELEQDMADSEKERLRELLKKYPDVKA